MNQTDFFDYHVRIEDGRRALVVDLLPEKACTFDCVYCPLMRTKYQTDTQMSFGDPGSAGVSAEISRKIREVQPDLVCLESKGESMLVSFIDEVIDEIHAQGLPVRLVTNGYILNDAGYRRIAGKCDEVAGELAAVSEEQFQKLSRPIAGYTLAQHVYNMASFNAGYKGQFIIDVIALRGQNDDPASISVLQALTRLISPDKVNVVQFTESDKFMRGFELPSVTLTHMRQQLEKASLR